MFFHRDITAKDSEEQPTLELPDLTPLVFPVFGLSSKLAIMLMQHIAETVQEAITPENYTSDDHHEPSNLMIA